MTLKRNIARVAAVSAVAALPLGAASAALAEEHHDVNPFVQVLPNEITTDEIFDAPMSWGPQIQIMPVNSNGMSD
ncbi:hypothetical protein [Salinactinospora qingdaonensis]|uniref:Uncharacterized protein n=1 Tax=Salinactinospora qingdaonensis TaxID=702744 RepID=A0ABP7FA20_9ACTN